MIDIVLCYSILEKCKSVDAFSEASENIELVRRIRQHRMVISEKLMEFYEEHFEKKGPEWLEWYRTLCVDLFYTKERSVIINCPVKRCYVKGNAYQDALVVAALSSETKDKMILMEPKRRMAPVKHLGISVYDVEDINDAGGNNYFSMYTLPVNGKAVSEGTSSKSIAAWLGRFLREESYIQIFDSYLLNESGIEYLKKYILKYMQKGAEIELYSLEHPGYSQQKIADIFKDEYFSKWKFSVYFINNKKNLHARSIQGSKYIIQMDRGLSVFGKSGKTYQSIINIFENNGTPRIVLKETQIKQIV